MSLLLLLAGAGVAPPAGCSFDGDAFDEDAFDTCPPPPPAACAFDPDAFDPDAFDTCPPPTPPEEVVLGGRVVRPQAVLRVDDEDDIAAVVAVLRHHLRL